MKFEQANKVRSEIKKEFVDMKENLLKSSKPDQEKQSYASIVTNELIAPIKTAMQQLKKEESKYRNEIIHGLSTCIDGIYGDGVDDIESACEEKF